MTETEIKMKGFKALTDVLGHIEAEKFISLIMREPFDYTVWQKKLWAEKSIGEISKAAMNFREKEK